MKTGLCGCCGNETGHFLRPSEMARGSKPRCEHCRMSCVRLGNHTPRPHEVIPGDSTETKSQATG